MSECVGGRKMLLTDPGEMLIASRDGRILKVDAPFTVSRAEPVEPGNGYAIRLRDGQVHIDFERVLRQAGTLQLVDVQGRVWARSALRPGELSAKLDLPSDAQGLYLLQLQSGELIGVSKLLIGGW